MKISCIYKIQSIVKPERIYIGSAKNVNTRWRNHKSQLSLNRHHSSILQNHYNKYGESDLVYSIVEECEVNNLITLEQKYIDNLNPYFNVCKRAGSQLGQKRSLASRLKTSVNNKLNGNKPPSQKGKHWKLSKESVEKSRISRTGAKRSKEFCLEQSERSKKLGIKPPSQKGKHWKKK